MWHEDHCTFVRCRRTASSAHRYHRIHKRSNVPSSLSLLFFHRSNCVGVPKRCQQQLHFSFLTSSRSFRRRGNCVRVGIISTISNSFPISKDQLTFNSALLGCDSSVTTITNSSDVPIRQNSEQQGNDNHVFFITLTYKALAHSSAVLQTGYAKSHLMRSPVNLWSPVTGALQIATS